MSDDSARPLWVELILAGLRERVAELATHELAVKIAARTAEVDQAPAKTAPPAGLERA